MSTRRAFVAGAALGVLATGRAGVARAEVRGDALVLEAAVRLEQTTVFVYDALLKDGGLEPGLTALRDHEQAHADALAAALEALGGPRPEAPTTREEGDAALDELGVPYRLDAKGDAALELVLELELRQVALYTRAVGELEDLRLIQTVASVVAAEGQHLVVIREALRRAPIPTPLEPGGG